MNAFISYHKDPRTLIKKHQLLGFHVKPLMPNNWFYILDFSDLTENTKRIGKTSEDAIFFAADVVGLYPSMSHKKGPDTLREKLVKEPTSKIPLNDFFKFPRLS